MMNDLISRQEAIDAIDVLCQEHRYKIPGKGETYSQYNEAWQDALDRAEGAIFNLPPAQPEKRTGERTETHACDSISRQAAISAICNACGKIDCDKMDKCEKLQLPPANCSEFPNNSDTISRQAAIDALKKDMASLDHIIKGMSANDVRLDAYVSQRNQVNYDIFTIKTLPPAEPKRGKWIYGEDSMADCVDGYRCDQCGFFVPWDYTHKSIDYIKDYNFCPNCGADMRQREE